MNLRECSLLEDVAFVGNVLAPFFLEDPRTGNARSSFEAVAFLDVSAAAAEWPFAAEADAASALRLMAGSLEACVDRASACELPGCAFRFVADDDLTWEYRRLFVGPTLKAAPPWGSVYLDRDQVIFGASTLELRAWMGSHGVRRQGSENDPEDHIGLMLALMAWLAQSKPEDLEDYLRLHLLTWAGHFLDLVIGEARHPFYEGLALLTKASLEGIREELLLQVETPRFYR